MNAMPALRVAVALLAIGGLAACTPDGSAAQPAARPNASVAPANPDSGTPSKPQSNPAATSRACVAGDVSAGFVSGGRDGTDYATAILLTSKRRCTLKGVSWLEIHTGGDGRTLTPNVVADSALPSNTVQLAPGDRARMSVSYGTSDTPGAECDEGASYALFGLPGDAGLVEAWAADRAKGLPPICSAVVLTPWTTAR